MLSLCREATPSEMFTNREPPNWNSVQHIDSNRFLVCVCGLALCGGTIVVLGEGCYCRSMYMYSQRHKRNAVLVPRPLDDWSLDFFVQKKIVQKQKQTYPSNMTVCITHRHKYYDVVASGRTRTLPTSCVNVSDKKCIS